MESNYEFKKKLEEMTKYSGRGTELISVYITPNYPVSEIVGKLRDEYGQASNIKSKTTQKNVQAAIEKIMSFLKKMPTPPENGVAIFCGNISETEGKPDIELFTVIPPQPLQVQFYRCESKFVLDPLLEITDNSDSYGILAMDGRDATVGVLKGKTIKVLKKLHSTAHQKFHKGGQSAGRFQRIHEETVEKYYQRIGEAMNAFLDIKRFKGVIVGGPGPTKEDFVKGKYFNYQLKIIGVVDIGYADESGLRELINKSSELISEQEMVKEKKIVDEFMAEIVKNGTATYGVNEIMSNLEQKNVSKLLVTEGFKLVKYTLLCPKCGKRYEKYSPDYKCECGGETKIEKEEDLLEEIIKKTEEQGGEVIPISTETQEGAQFSEMFHKIGALTRRILY
ncbi:MAG: peptide chain release factor aRF-1 [Candidatus Marsarchaeota archaeon]|nr:peptide chain release factor aRF-1 [Candidatus Marsarchaeota archaeon]